MNEAVKFAIDWWADRLTGKEMDIHVPQQLVAAWAVKLKRKYPMFPITFDMVEGACKKYVKEKFKGASDFEGFCFKKELAKVVEKAIEKDGFALLQLDNGTADFELAAVVRRLQISQRPLSAMWHVDMFVDRDKVQLRYDTQDHYETIFVAQKHHSVRETKAEESCHTKLEIEKEK